MAKLKASILKIIDAYQSKLSSYQSDFKNTPPIGGWSYSEVYSHIFDATLLSLHAIKNCSSGKAQQKPTPFLVKLILMFGAFPPNKRYKVPKSLEERVKKISKLEAEHLIDAVQKQVSIVADKVQSSDRNKKIKHPRLGYLNAQHWFRFIEIHLKHHLKQLDRIEKSFSQRI